ncbi:MAG: exodeoxyribonuclease V subunit gamma, partial [Pseudomonadota bacterium]
MYLLTQGNQVESLADQLLEQLAAPRDNPLASPWVLVPHAEMGQWLARRMARRHGCSANVSFVLAATALWDLMHRANPAIPRHNGYRPEVLAARIFAELGALPDQARLAPLRRYLAGRPSASVLRFSLRLAGLYDQYLVYRPEMVLRWEVGEGKDWQSWLWRRLAPDQPWHWARCVDWLKKNGASLTLKSAPPQVFVFGQSTLSQGFVHSLLAFAEVLPVHFYHWAPTAEYWSDVASPRRRTTGRDKPPEPLQDADLSPLLTSLGQPVKHMADFLQAGDPNEQDCWERPAERSLLGALRREMLYAGAEQESASADGSLLIQRCTSRRREVEVCIDTLSALFADTDLAPDDVLVLCPQLDQYLP